MKNIKIVFYDIAAMMLVMILHPSHGNAEIAKMPLATASSEASKAPASTEYKNMQEQLEALKTMKNAVREQLKAFDNELTQTRVAANEAKKNSLTSLNQSKEESEKLLAQVNELVGKIKAMQIKAEGELNKTMDDSAAKTNDQIKKIQEMVQRLEATAQASGTAAATTSATLTLPLSAVPVDATKTSQEGGWLWGRVKTWWKSHAKPVVATAVPTTVGTQNETKGFLLTVCSEAIDLVLVLFDGVKRCVSWLYATIIFPVLNKILGDVVQKAQEQQVSIGQAVVPASTMPQQAAVVASSAASSAVPVMPTTPTMPTVPATPTVTPATETPSTADSSDSMS